MNNKLSGLAQFGRNFWILNILQMLEKMAYVVVLLQLPIYMAQKDIAGGMNMAHIDKGLLFFVWAMVQRITPLLTGGLADRYGNKFIILLSYTIIFISYVIMAVFNGFWPLLGGIMLLGFGSGLYLPALQGAVSRCLNGRNESIGWGTYFMLLNLAVFFTPAISQYLKTISWEAVFWGSAAITLLNFLVISLLRGDNVSATDTYKVKQLSIVSIIKILRTPSLITFSLAMSGFVFIYMQFYETFPNFLYDWTDTRGFVEIMGMPDFMTMNTARGTMFSYEWIRNINSGVIILGIVFVSWGLSRIKLIYALALGMVTAALGLLASGISMEWYVCLPGIIIYSLGEMICNPKITEYLSSIAPEGQKSEYLSTLNISFGIGLGSGALTGGYMYQNMSEKASLALSYLHDNFAGQSQAFNLNNAFDKLCELKNLSPEAATRLLWESYSPYEIWYWFAGIGIVAAILLLLFRKHLSAPVLSSR